MDVPKYESDATLSEALLDEKCREKGWLWEVGSRNKDVPKVTDLIDATNCEYYCKIQPRILGPHTAIQYGKDPSEARMRALLMALRTSK